ncbi:nitrate/nitrite transporter [Tengunoibacter tsumagoiensis]|uniref:nitrate/nitrite transporter n=1 Tax=Tengunoibacter tsumagoiensis TaxID=2014871 RepID=UPI001C3FA787|nr:MFS transporter [Tengunoibacter tsumagoiensis]
MQTSTRTNKGSALTVFASFLHFDLCFTLWVLLGSLSIFITKDLRLNSAQQGLMVAIPTLSGSLMRIVMGILSDRFGGKRSGTAMLFFLFIPLFLAWLLPINFAGIIAIGLMLGVAGSSFAVALPLASHWYPPSRQGLIMGITAAGNIGTVVANLAAPSLAKSYGWHAVMGLSILPLAIVLVIFVLLAKDSPDRPVGVDLSRYISVLRSGDIWWFCLFYSVTFGGFVGLSTFLPLFLKNQYTTFNPITAGLFTALAAFLGSTFRPLGGFLADKIGGGRILTALLIGIGIIYLAISLLPAIGVMIWLFLLIMICLGMGNGAVFQLVPLRFRREIGIATGLVGAFGGVGGFFLPTLLGSIKQISGSYGSGLVILAIIAFIALVALRIFLAAQREWSVAPSVIVEGETA